MSLAKKHRSGRGNTGPDQEPSASKKTALKKRFWALTCWTEPENNEKQFKYLLTGREECPETGRVHWQTCVYFFNAKSLEEVVKYFGKRNCHAEHAKGTVEENIAYCTKDENYKEYGSKPSQGQRVDLTAVAEMIAKGKTVDELTLENPALFHQYGRTLNKLEELRMRKVYRTEMTKGIWYHGLTGVGKSHIAFAGFTPETHYVLPNDNGWWDGYAQQETVIINDFRGRIPYDEILQLVDKWPMSVRRRGREPMPFTSKRVIITSSLTPGEVYHNRDKSDSIEQLLRRFEVRRLETVLHPL